MTAAVPLDFEGDKSLKTYETALSTFGQIYGNVQVKHSTVTEIWNPLFWKVFSWNTLIYGLVPFPGRKKVVLNRLCSKIFSEISLCFIITKPQTAERSQYFVFPGWRPASQRVTARIEWVHLTSSFLLHRYTWEAVKVGCLWFEFSDKTNDKKL